MPCGHGRSVAGRPGTTASGQASPTTSSPAISMRPGRTGSGWRISLYLDGLGLALRRRRAGPVLAPRGRLVGWSMKADPGRLIAHGCADDGHPAAWKGRCAAASLEPRGRNIPDRFQRLPLDHGITCSMSRAGNVRDNPAMESFFSSLKTERTARMVYRTRDEARADAFDYIERFYNSGGVIRSWAISDGVRGTGHADFTRCPRNRQQAMPHCRRRGPRQRECSMLMGGAACGAGASGLPIA